MRNSEMGATKAVFLTLTIGAISLLGGCTGKPHGVGNGESALAGETSIWTNADVPAVPSDPDTGSVELGVKFEASTSGKATGVRFYKADNNTGTHDGHLWSADGQLLASVRFSDESASGWQTAHFSTPVALSVNTVYVVSYFAPSGHYAGDEGFFKDHSVTRGPLTALADGAAGGNGVYRYSGSPAFPDSTWHSSNYWVDVLFVPDDASPPPGNDAGTTTPPPANDAGTTTPPPAGDGGSLNLPRIPWEGGSAYWNQFSKANAAGWGNPSFFPIAVWYEQFSSSAEVQFDKSLGLNTYIGLNSSTDFSLMVQNGMFYIGESLNNTFDPASSNWVGYHLCDECEQNTQAAVDSFVQQRNALPQDGRFKMANYSQQVIGAFGTPSIWEQWVNALDAVSLDMYWYTLPDSSFTYANQFLVPVTQPRTASSYGKNSKALRIRDASDNKLQPIFSFVENVNGGPGEGPFVANITPGQLKGAVMSSLINEARGIIYFNSSLTGTCTGNPIFRHVEYNANDCAAPQTQAAKEINALIKQLALVLNTQSYQYSFGSGLDTMLKTSGGYAYVFAMIDGSSHPGSRTFTLPADLTGSSIEVVGENRSIAVSGGNFTDDFQYEYTYHIYRMPLSGGGGGTPPPTDAGTPPPPADAGTPPPADAGTPGNVTAPAPAANAGYTTLALNDDFNGTSLDTSIWSVGAPMSSFQFNGTTYWQTWNQELEYMTASQVRVENSTLILTAARAATPISGPSGTRSYVSGAVSTFGKFSKQFYYAEIRAKLPAVTGSATGLWPAIWTYDTSFAGNELDIMESFGGDQTTAQAHVWAPSNRAGSPVLDVDYNGLSGFNTYGVLKTPSTVQFFLNGVLMYTAPSQYIEADSPPQALILELKLGDNSWMPKADPSQWAGGVQGANTADLVIDWVRVWTR